VATEVYTTLADVPAFVPGQEPVPDAVADALARIERADAVVFSTPEYAGGLPGALKNLLDWTVGGGQLYDKPVAWLDVANPGRGHGARAQLRTVLGYVGARIIDAACVHVSLDGTADVLPLTPAQAEQLSTAAAALSAAVREDQSDADAS
jgi:NAD(P)H-dependent FMN reductase